jgi:hypothetical protein
MADITFIRLDTGISSSVFCFSTSCDQLLVRLAESVKRLMSFLSFSFSPAQKHPAFFYFPPEENCLFGFSILVLLNFSKEDVHAEISSENHPEQAADDIYGQIFLVFYMERKIFKPTLAEILPLYSYLQATNLERWFVPLPFLSCKS